MQPNTDSTPSETTGEIPLCVDLDGTLVRSDTLWETILQILRRKPSAVLAFAPAYLSGGRSAFKSAAVDALVIDPVSLPYHADIVQAIHAAREAGRPVHLVTGANQRLAQAIADHVGLFDDVIGSEPGRNNTGHDKADELVRRFGLRRFDYAGNSHADSKVWAKSHAAWVVGDSKRIAQAAALAPVAFHAPASPLGRCRALRNAIRPERFVIEAVVFLPAILSGKLFEFRFGTAVNLITAFITLVLISTSMRILGELLNLPAVRKRGCSARHPFAAGDLPLSRGVGLAAAFAAAACVLFLALPTSCIPAVAGFGAIAFVRAVRFELSRPVDFIFSAMSYALRLAAGVGAAGLGFDLFR